MFRLDENFTEEDLAAPVARAEENYLLQANDWIQVDVFTNDGERIVDPNNELSTGAGGANSANRRRFDYLIQGDGLVKLPVVDMIRLEGLTTNEAESVLEQAFGEYYVDCFVKLNVLNRRVVLLGANGGRVITLENENMSLAEVLALAGGLQMGAKGDNIKLIRGDLTAPQVYQIDMTTISGMRASVLTVEPGDIIYIEPWRRAWLVGLRDISPVLSITSSVIAFVLVIQNLSR